MSTRTLRLFVFLLAVASLGYGLVTMSAKAVERELFWDARAYYRPVAERYLEGEDPYLEAGRPTGYFYSVTLTPILARVFVDFESWWGLYAVGMGLGIAAAVALSLGAFRRPGAPLPAAILYALAFGNGQAPYLFVSANVEWLAGLLGAGSLLAASRGRWRLFYLLVGLAALIKPYSVALLAVPLALRAMSPWIALALLPPAVDALLSRWLWPGLGESRMAGIWMGLVEPLQLRFSLTGGLSRMFDGLGLLDPGTATAVGAAIHLGLTLALLLLLRTRGDAEPHQSLALAAVLACSAQPRLASYDAFIFGPAVFFAFWPETAGRGPRRWASLALLSVGVFKEGLVVLPIVLLAYLQGERRRRMARAHADAT